MKDLKLTDPRDPVPAPGKSRPPHLRALTTVRFLAALYVALYHLVRPFTLWGPLRPFFSAGYTGVSFFFLLSGFILTYTHADAGRIHGPELRRFYFARFARIYPVYLLLTFVAGVLLRSTFDKHIHIFAFLADLFMLQTWSIRMVNFFNNPAWSVSMEVFFYLVFPFVLHRMRPARPRSAILWIAALWGIAMIAPALAWWHAPATVATDLPDDALTFWVSRFPPFSLPEFLAGVTLGWSLLLWRPTRRQAWIFLLLGVTGALTAVLSSDHLPRIMLHNGLLVPCFACIILGLSQDTIVSRVLSAPWLLLLGEASYSLYLVHFMLGDWMNLHFGWDQGFQHLAVKLAVSIALSVLLLLTVERPSRKALLLWWNRKCDAASART